MNTTFQTGWVATDVAIRYTQNGKAVVHFNLAVQKSFQSKTENNADFFPVMAWGKIAEMCGNNLIKGRHIGIKGHLVTNTYTAKDGSTRKNMCIEVERLEFYDTRQQHGQIESATGSVSTDMQKVINDFGVSVTDDNIPF